MTGLPSLAQRRVPSVRKLALAATKRGYDVFAARCEEFGEDLEVIRLGDRQREI